jgi:hypothetical protein
MPTPRLRRVPLPPLPRATVLLRVLALALALVLLASGCGGDDGSKDNGSSAAKDDSGTDDGEKAADKEAKEPAPDPGFQAPKAGQCFRMTYRQTRASVAAGAPVRCQGPHTTVVSYIGFLPRAVTPQTPLAQRRQLGNRFCAPAFRRLVGGTLADRASSVLTWTMFTPGQAQLERGARWLRCDVLARSGNQLVPLPGVRPLLRAGVPEALQVCQTEEGADVSCARPHAFKVAAVFRVVGETYPDPQAYTPTARDRCKELMGTYGGFWQPPSQVGWRSGDRFVRCLARDS